MSPRGYQNEEPAECPQKPDTTKALGHSPVSFFTPPEDTSATQAEHILGTSTDQIYDTGMTQPSAELQAVVDAVQLLHQGIAKALL